MLTRLITNLRIGFAPRISFVLAVVLVAGAVMTGVLSIYKYERTLANLLTSRFYFVANDMRQKIETQMDLGLPLVHLQGVTEELDSYLRLDDQVLSIEVFDETGKVLFSTDASFVGDLVSENWLILWLTNQNKDMWSTLEIDAGIVGVPLHNNLSQNVGSLALRYSRDILNQSVNEQIERLLILGLAVVIVMSIFTFISCTRLLRGPIYDLRNMAKAMTKIMNQEEGDPALTEARERHPEFNRFAKMALAAYAAMDAGSDTIRKVDEEDQ